MIHREGGQVQLEVLQRMTAIMQHRGPNDAGHLLGSMVTGDAYDVERDPQPPQTVRYDIGLGNRRLSIIDLSPASHQPMCNQDRTLWITYNGEIYNYVELAEELRQQGYRFHTGSDTEVILHAYDAYGEACVNRLNGMWGFAIWDSRRRRLFCSRDRFGEKPFYYTEVGPWVLFASEIKALLQHPQVERAPNYRTVFRYVSSGYGFADVSDETFFAGIRQLPAAHSMIVDRSGTNRWRYWALEASNGQARLSDQQYVEEFRERFHRSVRLRLRSDVPVGFCLSGGLDSSAIVCTAAQLNSGVTTFSSCADDPRFDERQYIEPVVQQTHANAHYIFPDAAELFNVLPKMIWHQDEPWSNLNIFAHWYLMKAAREHGIPVLLNGHGGDETLAGYYPHFPSFHADLLKHGRLGKFVGEINAFAQVHDQPVAGALRRAAQELGSHVLGQTRAILRRAPRRYPHLQDDFVVTHQASAPPDRFSKSILRNRLMTGLVRSPIPGWLRYEDRNSMAFSVETRQPFLDHELVEFLFTVPDELKIHGGMNKVILRQALQGVLPMQIEQRSLKIGFKTPAEVWFRQTLREPIQALLASSRFRQRGIFDVDEVQRQFAAHCAGQVNRTFAIWSWVNLELWFQQMFDHAAQPTARAEVPVPT